MYFFHQDEEGQAWRLIGFTARLSLEMGLHRRDSLLRAYPNEAEYLWAVKLFWTIYSLDRRWSFGTGMPFALQDADIDVYLPEPVSPAPPLTHHHLTRIPGHIYPVSESNDAVQSHCVKGLVLRSWPRWCNRYEEGRHGLSELPGP